MKTLNINAEIGFTVKIEAIQFYKWEGVNQFDEETGVDYSEPTRYSSNVAVQCGDSGIVIICLSGDENVASAEWPCCDTLWSEEDKAFQDYIESEFTPSDFLKQIEAETGIENNMYYLEQYGEKMN